MSICIRCGEADARPGSELCGECAVKADLKDRRERPAYYRALRAARLIDEHDIRTAQQEWQCWATRPRMSANEAHYDCYRRCVGTLDGQQWIAGVVVAVEEGGAIWVYLPVMPDGWKLHQPFLKLDRDRVGFVAAKVS